jgi:hypothetical protein
MYFFLIFIVLSSSSDLSFQIIDDNRLELITNDYPLITSIESPSSIFFIDNRIIYFDEKNWTFVKLQVILKSAEGFLLSNQSYLIEKKKEEKGEEEEENKNIEEIYSFLPILSIFICLGIFGLFLIFKFKKNSNKYIPNKEKDRLIATEFYET